jgi:DNA modification methylase
MIGRAERGFLEGQKPLPLMEQLIADFTNEGDLVLDPFAGSGTTLLAAERLGRNSIGWEKKAEHFEIARRRLAGDEAKPSPLQPSFDFGAAK